MFDSTLFTDFVNKLSKKAGASSAITEAVLNGIKVILENSDKSKFDQFIDKWVAIYRDADMSEWSDVINSFEDEYAQIAKNDPEFKNQYENMDKTLTELLMERVGMHDQSDTLDIDSDFVRGYIEAMIFTGIDVGNTETGEGSSEFDINDISDDAEKDIVNDCNNFIHLAGEILAKTYQTEDYDEIQAGRDFWFTRNGHGVGFWDRGISTGNELTKIAETFGESYPYLGDDEKIHVQ